MANHDPAVHGEQVVVAHVAVGTDDQLRAIEEAARVHIEARQGAVVSDDDARVAAYVGGARKVHALADLRAPCAQQRLPEELRVGELTASTYAS